jgi:hypothetical protein
MMRNRAAGSIIKVMDGLLVKMNRSRTWMVIRNEKAKVV